MNKIRILLADDQLLVRVGIRALLESLPDYEVVGECEDGLGALEAIQTLQPDVAILDIAMPGLSGIEAARRIRQFDRRVKILVLSGIDRQDIIDEALAAGVEGYLLKDFILAELQLALATVAGNGRYLSPKIQERLIQRVMESQREGPPPASGGVSLTPRQTEILRLVALGQTTKQVAKALNISPRTVEFHRAQLMERTGVHDIAGLTRYALQKGLLE